ncbi:MAG: hypothetical protein H7Y02_00605 [Candidatus Obscuribacterales bacterium]|nr:hypothetical protein [Steroidobacteraceae bacterium]
MSNAINKLFGPSHYAVSTVAAVAYAVLWLVSARANPTTEYPVLEAVVVTAKRDIQNTALLAPVVVKASRDLNVSVALLDEVVVVGYRKVAMNDGDVRGGGVTQSPAQQRPWFTKAHHWIVSALLK